MPRVAALAVGVALLALAPVSLRAEGSGSVTATVVPSTLTITLEAPERAVWEGSPFPVAAAVEYAGDGAVAGDVRLHLASGDLRVRDGGKREVVLTPGRTERVKWQVCGEEAGSYVLMASVEANGGEWEAESVAVVVQIKGKKRSTCPAAWS
jgi:uncharacterized protein (DUF58 family)